MQHILLIDNFDSFTYNLVQLLTESGVSHQLHLVKNTATPDELPVEINKVLISPGPGLPSESGNLMNLVDYYVRRCPLLGICLGHQAIALYFGARLINLTHSAHGMKSSCYATMDGDPIFNDIRMPTDCGRYHSWAVDRNTLPDELMVTSTDASGIIMSLRHKSLPLTGLQFHPESYMTTVGKKMMVNWLTSN